MTSPWKIHTCTMRGPVASSAHVTDVETVDRSCLLWFSWPSVQVIYQVLREGRTFGGCGVAYCFNFANQLLSEALLGKCIILMSSFDKLPFVIITWPSLPLITQSVYFMPRQPLRRLLANYIFPFTLVQPNRVFILKFHLLWGTRVSLAFIPVPQCPLIGRLPLA